MQQKAGVTSKRLNDYNQSSKQTASMLRSYSPEDELNRDLDNRQRALVLTLSAKYKAVQDDNLWNDKDRLLQGQHKYTMADHTFRRSPQNLELIQAFDKYEKLVAAKEQVVLQRNNSLRRHRLRTLENKILIHKSDQPLLQSQRRELEEIEATDPLLFDNLISKKHWLSAVKDPNKKLENLCLKDLPQEKIDLLVSNKILELDRRGCDQILQKMLQEAKQQDQKLSLKQQERAKQIAFLHERHQKMIDLERQSGVKLGQRSNSVQPQMSISNEVFRGFALKFDPRTTQPAMNLRAEMLAIPKTEVRGHDFFLKPEFRGMLISDFQNAIGQKAYEKVDELNKTTVSQFKSIQSYQDEYTMQKTVRDFYDQKENRTTFRLTNTFNSTLSSQTKVPDSELAGLADLSRSKWAKQTQVVRRQSLVPINERMTTLQSVNAFVEPKRDSFRGSKSLLVKY